MKLANLVGDIAEDIGNGFRVQRRPVRGNAHERQTARVQGLLKEQEKTLDVLFCGIVINDVKCESFEVVIVYDGENAKRTVVEFIGRDIAGEIGENAVEAGGIYVRFRFFFPLPRPSSGWLRKAQTRGGRATGAKTRSGTAIRPPRRV